MPKDATTLVMQDPLCSLSSQKEGDTVSETLDYEVIYLADQMANYPLYSGWVDSLPLKRLNLPEAESGVVVFKCCNRETDLEPAEIYIYFKHALSPGWMAYSLDPLKIPQSYRQTIDALIRPDQAGELMLIEGQQELVRWLASSFYDDPSRHVAPYLTGDATMDARILRWHGHLAQWQRTRLSQKQTADDKTLSDWMQSSEYLELLSTCPQTVVALYRHCLSELSLLPVLQDRSMSCLLFDSLLAGYDPLIDRVSAACRDAAHQPVFPIDTRLQTALGQHFKATQSMLKPVHACDDNSRGYDAWEERWVIKQLEVVHALLDGVLPQSIAQAPASCWSRLVVFLTEFLEQFFPKRHRGRVINTLVHAIEDQLATLSDATDSQTVTRPTLLCAYGLLNHCLYDRGYQDYELLLLCGPPTPTQQTRIIQQQALALIQAESGAYEIGFLGSEGGYTQTPITDGVVLEALQEKVFTNNAYPGEDKAALIQRINDCIRLERGVVLPYAISPLSTFLAESKAIQQARTALKDCQAHIIAALGFSPPVFAVTPDRERALKALSPFVDTKSPTARCYPSEALIMRQDEDGVYQYYYTINGEIKVDLSELMALWVPNSSINHNPITIKNTIEHHQDDVCFFIEWSLFWQAWADPIIGLLTQLRQELIDYASRSTVENGAYDPGWIALFQQIKDYTYTHFWVASPGKPAPQKKFRRFLSYLPFFIEWPSKRLFTYWHNHVHKQPARSTAIPPLEDGFKQLLTACQDHAILTVETAAQQLRERWSEALQAQIIKVKEHRDQPAQARSYQSAKKDDTPQDRALVPAPVRTTAWDTWKNWPEYSLLSQIALEQGSSSQQAQKRQYKCAAEEMLSQIHKLHEKVVAQEKEACLILSPQDPLPPVPRQDMYSCFSDYAVHVLPIPVYPIKGSVTKIFMSLPRHIISIDM